MLSNAISVSGCVPEALKAGAQRISALLLAQGLGEALLKILREQPTVLENNTRKLYNNLNYNVILAES